MKSWKRLMAAALSGALMLAALTGCGSDGQKGQDADQTDGADSAIYALSGLKPQEVLFTVDGVEVTAGDYGYWLAYSMETASTYLYDGGSIVWTDEQDGLPMPEYVKNDAQEVSKVFAIAEKKAAEYGVELNEDDLAQLDQMMQDYVTAMGEDAWAQALEAGTVSEDMSDEDRAAWLEENGSRALAERCYELVTTTDGLRELERMSLLYTRLQETLYAPGGPMAVSDEELSQWLAEQDVYKAKHILISTQDEEGNTLDDAGKAAARQRAEELIDQLSKSDDPIALFDQLMQENSEDPGLAAYPDGYLFYGSQMVTEFTDGVKALKENEISGIVESENGYHIILRLSPVEDSTRSLYAGQHFPEVMDQWLSEAQVEEKDAFVNLNVEDFYTKLTALQTDEEQ